MHYGDMGSWGWMMVVGALVWIGFLAAIAAIAWAAIRHESATPLDLLKERYARGQIIHEQYEQTKKDLVQTR